MSTRYVRKREIEKQNILQKVNLTVAVNKLAGFLNLRSIGEKVFSDLVDTWWIIGVSLAGIFSFLHLTNIYYSKSGACILSFVWILLMRYLSSLMVWLSIVCVIVGLGALLCYCGYRLYWVTISTDPEATKNILQVNCA